MINIELLTGVPAHALQPAVRVLQAENYDSLLALVDNHINQQLKRAQFD